MAAVAAAAAAAVVCGSCVAPTAVSDQWWAVRHCSSQVTTSCCHSRSAPPQWRDRYGSCCGSPPMWKAAAQRLRPMRPSALKYPARASAGRPPASPSLGQPRPASASLGQLAKELWLAGYTSLAFLTYRLARLGPSYAKRHQCRSLMLRRRWGRTRGAARRDGPSTAVACILYTLADGCGFLVYAENTTRMQSFTLQLDFAGSFNLLSSRGTEQLTRTLTPNLNLTPNPDSNRNPNVEQTFDVLPPMHGQLLQALPAPNPNPNPNPSPNSNPNPNPNQALSMAGEDGSQMRCSSKFTMDMLSLEVCSLVITP
eukprot:scaffold21045_cov59-Phaeocystis_antarctica.AAC.6